MSKMESMACLFHLEMLVHSQCEFVSCGEIHKEPTSSASMD